MTVETECRRALERLNGSIGQKVRWAHHDLREMAENARLELYRFRRLPARYAHHIPPRITVE